jgi:hypothetical protein
MKEGCVVNTKLMSNLQNFSSSSIIVVLGKYFQASLIIMSTEGLHFKVQDVQVVSIPYSEILDQGTLIDGKGSVRLTSS